MNKTVIILLSLSIFFPLTAQNEIDAVLREIETNSTTLIALRQRMEAQKTGNLTGIYLSDPEIEFNYLWGTPAAIGNRTDFRITQSLDFPTVYAHRKKISSLENENLDALYRSERINLLLRAKQICIELVFYNALTEEYSRRMENARRIAESYRMRFDRGDANVLERNKAEVNLTSVGNEKERVEAERLALLTELKAMNGGKEIELITTAIIDAPPLPADFEEWYVSAESRSPVLQYIVKQIEIGRQQVKLNRALGLPKLTTGYMSEKIAGESFQGLTLGISIPLWENKNRVKQAKLTVKAAEIDWEDNKVRFYNKLKSLFIKCSGLYENVRRYRLSLSAYNNETFLKKALDAGEISLLTYLIETEYYYDTISKTLESERDLRLALAELSALEL